LDIQSKTIIITGASSGLGAAVSRTLVKADAGYVYGLARSKDKLNALQTELGNTFIPVVLDVSDLNLIRKWYNSTFSESHSPDILINNAGTGGFAPIDVMQADEWIGMLDTNLKGMYYMTSAAIPLMKTKTGSKHIINIGSIMGTTTRGEASAYSASKYAVNGFSESLFKELRGFDIKVTCVNPGSIETDFFINSGIQPSTHMLHPDEVADTILYILKTPDNVLIDEIKIRPLKP